MEPRIVLIGDVYLDVTLTPIGNQKKMRLGGIIHPARALWALGIPYDFAYISPDYLDEPIENYVKSLGAVSTTKIGSVSGSPNVAFIGEPTEAGNQNYELLMREAYKCELNANNLKMVLENESVTDIVIFPGSYNLETILIGCSTSTAKTHIDIAYGLPNLKTLECLRRKFNTGILSTSSELFLDHYQGVITNLRDELLKNYCESFLFKENRGGSRLFDQSDSDPVIYTGAQIRRIVHSVGIGDCYDVIFVALKYKFGTQIALDYASWIAAEYASTTYVDDFKDRCRQILTLSPDEIVELKGVSLPWEKRTSFQIYIAAPDFDTIDRTKIDQLLECLRYHNFTTRPPVREFGQMPANATPRQKQYFYDSDVRLLYECQMVLAVMLYDDPGTLVEIGLALGAGIPVIIYDPYNEARNPMVTQSAHLISSNLDEIIGQVFVLASKGEL
jgi:nucleoside 2-deoxyribosyltransferase